MKFCYLYLLPRGCSFLSASSKALSYINTNSSADGYGSVELKYVETEERRFFGERASRRC